MSILFQSNNRVAGERPSVDRYKTCINYIHLPLPSSSLVQIVLTVLSSDRVSEGKAIRIDYIFTKHRNLRS